MLEPLPFEHLFRPLVADAAEEVRRWIDASTYGLLSTAGHAGWEQYLAARLSAAGAKAALWRFHIFKTVRTAFPRLGCQIDQPVDSLYRQFVGDEPRREVSALFAEFPALGKLCEALIRDWISTVSEFLRRLDVDRGGFNSRFGEDTSVHQVVKIEAGLSDAHRGGRCVVKLVFSSGATIIYKPRSVATEEHFSVLLEHVNTTGIPHPLRPSVCWDRGEYGWMAQVEPCPCGARSEVAAFYWRAGVLLGLVYLARGVDFHRENLIAAGEHPVLVDLEGLWHPQNHSKSSMTVDGDSILRTGFLSYRDVSSGLVYDRGALSLNERVLHPATTLWTHINRDEMDLVQGRRAFEKQTHLPAYAGAVCLASPYVDDILAGFEWLGGYLLATERGQDALNQWLRSLLRCRRRLILRSTAHYQAILERLTPPNFLRGEIVSVKSAAARTEIATPLQDEELRALGQLEVPYFEQPRVPPFASEPIALSVEKYNSQLPIVAAALANT